MQRRQKRPANLNRASHDRLNHWCLDRAHEDFQIYTIPGKMNVYNNDFHSRGEAPDAQPFYTLQEHERRLEAKLKTLEKVSEGAAASADPVEEVGGETTVP